MTQLTLRMLRLIGAEINDALVLSETPAFSEEELERLSSIASAHGLTHLLASALDRRGLLGKEEISEELRCEMLKTVWSYQQKTFALEEIRRVLDACEIRYLPLKGAVLAGYYPAPWMRTSCDIDVLVSRVDLDAAASALERELSYERRREDTHDVSLYSPTGVHLELHFDLVEEGRARNAAEVLSTVWDTVRSEEGSYACTLSDEMFYFYHVAHMAKHLERSGGCGLRSFLDLWVLEHRVPHDGKARDELLRRGGLLTFAKTARHLSEVWFGGGEADAEALALQDFLLRGGAYGSAENRVTVEQGRRGGRVGFLLSRIFLSYGQLKYRYPILQKHKWLFPIMQVVRWCSLPFGGRLRRSMSELQRSRTMSDETIREGEAALRAFGLE